MKEKIRKNITVMKKKYSILLSILCEVLFFGAIRLAGMLWPNKLRIEGYLPQLILEGIAVLTALLLLFAVGEEKCLKERGRGFFRGIFTGGYLAAIAIINTISMLWYCSTNPLLPFGQITVFVLLVWSIGMAEEFLFRGLITNLLIKQFGKTKKGIWFTIIFSGFLFGSAHLTNILSGVEASGVIVQAAVAMVVGALFAAIYIRNRNIWSVVFLHAFIDFAGMMASGLYGIGSLSEDIASYGPEKILASAIYFIPLFVVMRKSKTEEILEEQNRIA